jgi:integrase
MSVRPFGFVRVRKGKPSPFVAGYNPAGGGREITRAFTTMAQADLWLAERHVAESSATGAPIAPTTTLDAYWSRYIATAKLKPSSSATYRQHYRTHIAPAFGPKALGAITKSQVQQWLDDLPLSPSTAITVLRILQAVLNSAVDDEILLVSPARKIVPPKVRRTRVTIPTGAQVQALADAISAHYRIAVWLAADAGLRQGEVLGLEWGDVDWDTATLHVSRQAQTVPGLGVLLDQPTKSDAGVRSVPLSERLAHELKLHRSLAPAGDLVVTTAQGTPVRRNRLYEHWMKACRTTGSTARFHDLRHRFASMLIAAGLSLFEVKVLMGHRSIEETDGTYGHLVPGAVERVRAALSGF